MLAKEHYWGSNRSMPAFVRASKYKHRLYNKATIHLNLSLSKSLKATITGSLSECSSSENSSAHVHVLHSTHWKLMQYNGATSTLADADHI